MVRFAPQASQRPASALEEQPDLPRRSRQAASPADPPPLPRRPPWVVRYGLALATVVIFLGIRLVIEPFVGESSRFMIFLPALVLSAWFGGTGAGLFALAASCLLGLLFLIPPKGLLAVPRPADLVGMGIYLGSGLVLVGARWAQLRASERLARARAEQGRLARLREHAEASLHRTQEELTLLIDAVTDYAIILVDPHGRIASWNSGAQRLLGWTAPEVIGRPTSILSPEDAADHAIKILEAATSEGRHEEVAPRCRKDGSTFTADVVVTPIRDEGGSLIGFAKVTRDITEQVRAQLEIRALADTLERRVQDRTAQLAAANEELEAFAHTLTHDLRAPVRSMETYAEVLREEYAQPLGPQGRAHVDRIARAAAKMDRLIEGLLEYSRLSHEDLPLGPVSLESAVDDAVALVRADLSAARASLTVDRPLPTVLAHAPTLTRMIANLLVNAAKFVAPGVTPQIRVSAQVTGRRVRLDVADNGIGIAPEDQQRIFSPFERLHGEETYPGTGIGLAIVRKAAERMHGAAGVESTRGSGSRFWVELEGVGRG